MTYGQECIVWMDRNTVTHIKHVLITLLLTFFTSGGWTLVEDAIGSSLMS